MMRVPQALVAVVTLALSLPVAAQWPTFEAKRAPRAADGTVDLDRSGTEGRRRPSRSIGSLGTLRPRRRESGVRRAAIAGRRAARRDVLEFGRRLRGGLPYTPLAALLREERMADNQKNNPDALCLPMGLMQLHLHPQPRKIVQTPGLILIMYEGNEGLRQIFTDGRPLPTPGDELQPWWYGYSTGRWEGDTLVVETVGFRDDVWLDVLGSPLTSSGKMTERFRRLNFGTLQIEVTIEDPMAYKQPFTLRVNQRLFPDAELIEFICNENEKSIRHYDP